MKSYRVTLKKRVQKKKSQTWSTWVVTNFHVEKMRLVPLDRAHLVCESCLQELESCLLKKKNKNEKIGLMCKKVKNFGKVATLGVIYELSRHLLKSMSASYMRA
jgi:hypothetical protein